MLSASSAEKRGWVDGGMLRYWDSDARSWRQRGWDGDPGQTVVDGGWIRLVSDGPMPPDVRAARDEDRSPPGVPNPGPRMAPADFMKRISGQLRGVADLIDLRASVAGALVDVERIALEIWGVLALLLGWQAVFHVSDCAWPREGDVDIAVSDMFHVRPLLDFDKLAAIADQVVADRFGAAGGVDDSQSDEPEWV